MDKNPLAVDLAKLSLWLATLAKDHPFTFLDHALNCGDSLVGLTKAQILAFHWKPEKHPTSPVRLLRGSSTGRLEPPRQIREPPDGTSEAFCASVSRPADGFLDQARRYGNLVIAAFFAGDNERKRKDGLESLSDDLCQPAEPVRRSRQQRLTRRSASHEPGLSRSPHSTGRLSSPRSSTGRIQGSMRSWETRRFLYAFRQFHAPLEIYRGLQTVLIVSVSSRTAHRLLTASSCNAS